MNEQVLTSQLIRNLRGRRSQTALSRRLKYRTNVVYQWEAGNDFPFMPRFFELLERVGHNPRQVLAAFHRGQPEWLDGLDLLSDQGVAQWLRELRGTIPIVDLAEATGFSRFSISRWLKGQSAIRVDQCLRLIEACSLRALDFIATFSDPTQLPAAREAWSQLEALREAAHRAPWSQAVLRVLELPSYRTLRRHNDVWIAKRLGINPEEVHEALALLQQSGQVMARGCRLVTRQSTAVDTRSDPDATRKQRAFWTKQALERLQNQQPGVFSYNVFGVSAKDLARIRQLHSAYFAEVRAIIAASEPTEQVVLFTSQLLSLDGSALPSGA